MADPDLARDPDPGRLDLNLLSVFDMVMIERHVTRAAERLGLTQSAVSNSLNRLRVIFDDQLFIKAARGVAPTPRALALWPDIHTAIGQLKRTVRPTEFDPQTADTEFRMSMVDLSAALLTPYLFGCVSALAPNVTVSFTPHDPSLTNDRFARGDIDFAIGVEPPRLAVLEAKPLWTERYMVAGRWDHPLLKQPLTIEDLCRHPQLVVNLSSAGNVVSPVDIALAEMGRARRIALTVNQFLVATSVLRESDLLAVLPSSLVAQASPLNWLTAQPLPIEGPSATLYLIWHRRSNGLAPMTWFKERVFEAVDALDADRQSSQERTRP